MSLRRALIGLGLTVPLLMLAVQPAMGGGISAKPTSLKFSVEVNNNTATKLVTVTNQSGQDLFSDSYGRTGTDANDFEIDYVTSTCDAYSYPSTLADGGSCTWALYFSPDELGRHTASFYTRWTDYGELYQPSRTVKLTGTAYASS